MRINREKLLTALKIASVGAALPPRMVTLEQSDCFIFKKGFLTCFNDEILTRQASPLDFDMIVHAGDFLKVLEKLPDKDVEIFLKKGEVIIKGSRRSAGITVQKECKLPFEDVPRPVSWARVQKGVTGLLKQAARTCGKDLSNPLTTVVHVTPKTIEACDNFRLFRATKKTGFKDNVLIPAFALASLETIPILRVSVTKPKGKNSAWAHFKTSGKAVVSVRLMSDEYMDLTPILKIKEVEHVTLPGNLADMVERSNIMQEGADPIVRISIGGGLLSLRSRKDSGWFRETRKIHYRGRELNFQVNPKFLVEVLQRTTQVAISTDKMKLAVDEIQFVVVLEAAE